MVPTCSREQHQPSGLALESVKKHLLCLIDLDAGGNELKPSGAIDLGECLPTSAARRPFDLKRIALNVSCVQIGFHGKSPYEESGAGCGNERHGTNDRRLLNQRIKRPHPAVGGRPEGLRTIVGYVAINPRSSKRESRACGCSAKYSPDHRSQHIPISKGERRWYASSWDLYRESHYEP